MSTFAEKKAAAKAAARPFRDVPVALDSDVSRERDELMAAHAAISAELEAARNTSDPRLTQAPDTAAVEKRLAASDRKLAALEKRERDTLTTIRLYKVPPQEWVALAAAHSFDLNAMCAAAAVDHARILDGDTELTQTAEEWAENWDLIGVPSFNAVMNETYDLNVLEPQARLERLKNS